MSIIYVKPSSNKAWVCRFDADKLDEWIRGENGTTSVQRCPGTKGASYSLREYINSGAWMEITEEEAFAIVPSMREFVERYLNSPDRPATITGDHW